ncbi:hypothetical protein DFJ73DRAFT_798675 [Zopfochytrium polystomum]|nr:hypothetical protein DFJ73DRAFT_798675 [Zopfochytrium polystomum]
MAALTTDGDDDGRVNCNSTHDSDRSLPVAPSSSSKGAATTTTTTSTATTATTATMTTTSSAAGVHSDVVVTANANGNVANGNAPPTAASRGLPEGGGGGRLGGTRNVLAALPYIVLRSIALHLHPHLLTDLCARVLVLRRSTASSSTNSTNSTSSTTFLFRGYDFASRNLDLLNLAERSTHNLPDNEPAPLGRNHWTYKLRWARLPPEYLASYIFKSPGGFTENLLRTVVRLEPFDFDANCAVGDGIRAALDLVVAGRVDRSPDTFLNWTANRSFAFRWVCQAGRSDLIWLALKDSPLAPYVTNVDELLSSVPALSSPAPAHGPFNLDSPFPPWFTSRGPMDNQPLQPPPAVPPPPPPRPVINPWAGVIEAIHNNRWRAAAQILRVIAAALADPGLALSDLKQTAHTAQQVFSTCVSCPANAPVSDMALPADAAERAKEDRERAAVSFLQNVMLVEPPLRFVDTLHQAVVASVIGDAVRQNLPIMCDYLIRLAATTTPPPQAAADPGEAATRAPSVPPPPPPPPPPLNVELDPFQSSRAMRQGAKLTVPPPETLLTTVFPPNSENQLTTALHAAVHTGRVAIVRALSTATVLGANTIESTSGGGQAMPFSFLSNNLASRRSSLLGLANIACGARRGRGAAPQGEEDVAILRLLLDGIAACDAKEAERAPSSLPSPSLTSTSSAPSSSLPPQRPVFGLMAGPPLTVILSSALDHGLLPALPVLIPLAVPPMTVAEIANSTSRAGEGAVVVEIPSWRVVPAYRAMELITEELTCGSLQPLTELVRGLGGMRLDLWSSSGVPSAQQGSGNYRPSVVTVLDAVGALQVEAAMEAGANGSTAGSPSVLGDGLKAEEAADKSASAKGRKAGKRRSKAEERRTASSPWKARCDARVAAGWVWRLATAVALASVGEEVGQSGDSAADCDLESERLVSVREAAVRRWCEAVAAATAAVAAPEVTPTEVAEASASSSLTATAAGTATGTATAEEVQAAIHRESVDELRVISVLDNPVHAAVDAAAEGQLGDYGGVGNGASSSSVGRAGVTPSRRRRRRGRPLAAATHAWMVERGVRSRVEREEAEALGIGAAPAGTGVVREEEMVADQEAWSRIRDSAQAGPLRGR